MHTAQAVTRSRAGEHVPRKTNSLPASRALRVVATEQPGGASPVEVLAAYRWSRSGRCFRCGSHERHATPIATVEVPQPGAAAVAYELVMCGGCVLREEERLERRADARGTAYTPGGIRPRGEGGSPRENLGR